MPKHELLVVLGIAALLACHAGAAKGNELFDAAERGDAAAGRAEIVKLLLDRKAAPNRPPEDEANTAVWPDDRSPLHAAAGRGYVAIAKLLIDHGANLSALDYEKHTPLDTASGNSDSTWAYGRGPKDLPPCRPDLVVTLLLDAYQKQKQRPPQASLDKALCWAAGQGAFDVVQRLVQAGANVNARGQYERTPLVEAVSQFANRSYDSRSAQAEKRKQHVAIIKLLMARSADPNLGDRNGSALWYAREHRKDKEFVDLLSQPNSAAKPGK